MTKTHLVIEEEIDLEQLGLNGKIIDGRTEIYFFPYSKAQKEVISAIEHKISEVVSYIYCESGGLSEEGGSAYICATVGGFPIKKTRRNKQNKIYSIVNYKYAKCYVKRNSGNLYIKLSTIIPSYPLDIETIIWEYEGDSIRVPARLARYESLVNATVERSYSQEPENTYYYEELHEKNTIGIISSE
jgi:hypothetical protein